MSSLADSKKNRIDISPPSDYYEKTDKEKEEWCLAVAKIIHEKLLTDKK